MRMNSDQAVRLIEQAVDRIINLIGQWEPSAPRCTRQGILDDICEDVLHLGDMREHLDSDQQWFERYARSWWYERYCVSYYR